MDLLRFSSAKIEDEEEEEKELGQSVVEGTYAFYFF